MGGAGGVELRENSIRILFTYGGKQRKETLYLDNAPLAPTPANGKYAKRIAAEVRKAIQNGTFDYAAYFPHSPHANTAGSSAPLLHDVMDDWLDTLSLAPSTARQYRTRINSFWKSAIPNKAIDRVKHSDILSALSSGTWKSGKSRNNELSMIRQFFDYAVLDRLIAANPTEGVARASYQKPPPDPFELAEANLIVDHLLRHRHEQIGNWADFMFFTGMRTSEGIGLQWPKIDLRKREALVDGGVVYDEETDSTKTAESRIVKLNSRAMAALERQKAHTYLKGQEVFQDPHTGEPWAYAKITDVRSFWQATLKKLGIRYRRPYNMRHTYASIGLKSGAKPGFLAKQLGHSLRMFFTVYAKWIDSADDDLEMEKLEGVISRAGDNLRDKSGVN